MSKYWNEESILSNPHPHHKPADIFSEVCASLGNYYKLQGYKYMKGSKKITKVIRDFTVEVCFWSSRSNTPGVSTMLEIITGIYYKKSMKTSKRKGNYTLGHLTINNEIDRSKEAGIRTVLCIDGRSSFSDNNMDYSEISKNPNVNVYKIDDELFESIVHFIDEQIRVIEVLYDKESLKDFILNKRPHDKKSLLRDDFSFIEFIKDHYGDDECLVELLASK